MDLERRMEFSLQQNARVESNLELLGAKLLKGVERQYKLDDVVTSLAESMIVLAEHGNRVDDRGRKTDERLDRISEKLDGLTDRVDRLAYHGHEIDERIDKLVSSIGEFIRRSNPN